MSRQRTIGTAFTLSGVGLHTGVLGRVTVQPAPAGYGWRIADLTAPRLDGAMTWVNRTPSIMSTAIDLGGGRMIRTVEHLMASLAAFGVDNVRIAVEGSEIPIFDGSARAWCAALTEAGVFAQEAQRRVIRIVKPVQIVEDGGFLRAEPAETASLDITYDVLPDFPVMRWSGTIGRECFLAELAGSRSFGRVKWRKALRLPPSRKPRPPGTPTIVPHLPDPRLMGAGQHAGPLARPAPPRMPVLRGGRLGRGTLVVGPYLLPPARFRDEPMRHVALDMIGDLALAGAPLLGRIVAHNPSHEKTYQFVAALMRDKTAWAYAAAPDAVETTDPACFALAR